MASIADLVGQLPLQLEGTAAVITSVSTDTDLVLVGGYGAIADPETDDDSWTVRIVNPPVLVPDPLGAVQLERNGTVETYRHDPAQVVLDVLVGVIEGQQ